MAISAEHRSKFAAIYRQRCRLYMSEQISSGKPHTNKKNKNKNKYRYHSLLFFLVLLGGVHRHCRPNLVSERLQQVYRLVILRHD